ncbi:MAG TPA: cytochrome C oxidase subunit IV family protein [Thermodesulfobacteriota bacterium]|nr:cytochrome C oxidase subunit IV family protein [Thermodesulfobacteriota bacterium]
MSEESRTLRYGAYVLVWAGLLILTLLTVAASRAFAGVLGHVALPLLIATVKAGLVVFFFMHLKYERGIFRSIPLAVVLVFMVLFLFLFSDVAFR